jgi:hypothetical protein
MENDKMFELLEKMYIELQDIKQSVINNTKKTDNIEKSVLNIEQKHGSKLEALFDGYKQNTEKLNRIENELAKNEEVILKRIK